MRYFDSIRDDIMSELYEVSSLMMECGMVEYPALAAHEDKLLRQLQLIEEARGRRYE